MIYFVVDFLKPNFEFKHKVKPGKYVIPTGSQSSHRLDKATSKPKPCFISFDMFFRPINIENMTELFVCKGESIVVRCFA